MQFLELKTPRLINQIKNFCPVCFMWSFNDYLDTISPFLDHHMPRRHTAGSDTSSIQIAMEAPKEVPVQGCKKNVENACFLMVFQIFFNLGSILAHQISMSLFS